MKLATWHFHIEISSKCTLRCPRCARSEVPDTLVNTELDLAFFKKNFTPEFIIGNVEKITLCGDDGDPIYAHDLIPVINYFKSIKPVKFVIVTNGSYKKTDWWKSLAQTLTSDDHIHFSLDGWDQTSNEKYRVNSDWSSIIQGIKTLKAHCAVYMTWDAIAFEFNQDHLSDMKLLARDLGFDQFQLTLSTKFNKVYDGYPSNDWLQPRNELISSNYRFQRIFTKLSNRKESEIGFTTNQILYNTARSYGDVVPLCSIGNKGLFINSQGHLFPCCWVANRYQHNQHWLDLGRKFDLNKISLQQALDDDQWQDEKIFHRTECRTKCNISVVDQNYATQW